MYSTEMLAVKQAKKGGNAIGSLLPLQPGRRLFYILTARRAKMQSGMWPSGANIY